MRTLSEWMDYKKMRPEDVAAKTGLSFATVKRAMGGESVGNLAALALASLTGMSSQTFSEKRGRNGKLKYGNHKPVR